MKAAQRAQAHQTYVVLFADDSPTMHRVMQITLAGEPCALELAADGATAIALAATRRIDLAILDLDMPKMDGLATAAALRRNGFAGAILLLPGPASRLDPGRALAAGISSQLRKPFLTQACIDCVHSLLGVQLAAATLRRPAAVLSSHPPLP